MKPISTERFLDLIGSIYDCALEPGRWSATLESVCLSMGCCFCTIYQVDMVTGATSLVTSSGGDRIHIDAWLREWSKSPALHEIHLELTNSDIDAPFVLSRHTPAELACEDAKRQGLCDVVQAIVHRSHRRVGVLTAGRHETVGLATDCVIATMRRLAPHVRRAVTVGGLMNMAEIRTETCRCALDALNTAVILVGGDRVILEANTTGAAMLASGVNIRAENGRLFATCPKANDELGRALDMARGASMTAGSGNEAGGDGFAVPLAKPGRAAAIARVLPLRRDEIRTRVASPAVAGVFISISTSAPHADVDAVGRSYGLTPAETRLLKHLADGKPLVEATRALDIAETTGRLQLSRIFDKTGVTRQIDLIALVCALAPPLRR